MDLDGPGTITESDRASGTIPRKAGIESTQDVAIGVELVDEPVFHVGDEEHLMFAIPGDATQTAVRWEESRRP